MRVLCAAAALALLSPAVVAAQICAGRASFDATPLQLRGAAAVSVSQRQARLAVAHGTDRLFAQAAAHADSRSSAGRYALSGGVGSDQPLTLDNRWHVCPVVEIAYRWRPTSGGDAASLELSAGGNIGLLAVNTASSAVIPAVAIGFRRAYPFGPAAAERGGGSVLIGGALGIVLRRGLAFRPGVVRSFGGGAPQWGVTAELSLNVARR